MFRKYAFYRKKEIKIIRKELDEILDLIRLLKKKLTRMP
jgi:hypothetical protein